MGSEAKAYLQEHYIPQLFEGLMTGLIYNRPSDPISFLEESLAKVRENPDEPFAWDMFIYKTDIDREPVRTTPFKPAAKKKKKKEEKEERELEKQRTIDEEEETPKEKPNTSKSTRSGPDSRASMGHRRVPSVIKAAETATIPEVPIVLFMGGPGGGKTRIAARVYAALADRGLVHICMPDVVRNALQKYKDKYPEWREAHEAYMRGELIPNHLALALVKAEMGRHQQASAFFLEGFPREARQVEDFERQVRPVNMALILDYDERTLRDHMEKRGLGMEIIDQKIKEFKQKTLPSAKYFDEQRLLHLIPGEKDEHTIFERMKTLVVRALESGVPVINSNPPSAANYAPPTRESGTHSNQNGHASRASRGSRRDSQGAPSRASRASSKQQSAETPVPDERAKSKASRAESQGAPENEERRSETASSKRSSSRKTHRSDEGTQPQTPIEEKNESGSRASQKTPDRASSVVAANGTSSRQAESRQSFRGLPNNAPVVLVIGAPGSNKADFAQKIAKKYDGFVLFSMGDLLRKQVVAMRGDELWDRVGKKMEQGEAVPMKICRDLLYEAIQQSGEASWGYVVEGYPRSLSELTDFDTAIGRIDVAVLIDCTEQFCLKTIADRYAAGVPTHTERADDDATVVKVRLGLFKQNTLPMLKLLDDRAKLRVVDGDLDSDRIFLDITSAIDSSLYIGEDNGQGDSLESSKNDA